MADPSHQDDARAETTTDRGPRAGRRLRRWGRRLRDTVVRFWRRLPPSPPVRKGVAWGAVASALAVAALVSLDLRPGLGPGLDQMAGAVLGLILGLLAGLGALSALKVLFVLPRFLGWLGIAALAIFFAALGPMGFPAPIALALAAALTVVEGALGGGIAFFVSGAHRRAGGVKKAAAVLVVAAALAINGALIAFLADRGDSDHLVTTDWLEEAMDEQPARPLGAPSAGSPPASAPSPPPLALADPAERGAYPVATLTYGSGEDRHRPEFGAGVTLETEPVDASPFVDAVGGWRGKVRRYFWGFDFEAVPRNGRVWYPEGEGPFPLALIVHGNHDMAHYSDPGYAYLGEHLASRGTILVSVDENFFNGGFAGGMSDENDARGWLLLEHLELWRDWNATPGNPFTGKVDLDRVALMGHSRGGEAAAIAAAFNRLSRYPDDAGVTFDYGFGIQAVVAIAPSDGQYRPAGRRTPLSEVSYLVLHGAHDADVSSFVGARQLDRVELGDGDPYRFKASLYSYRSNHGQFNSVWGDNDVGWPRNRWLNKAPLLPAAEQRRIALVAITAFLEATLGGETGYVELFRDPRRGAAWLPADDILVSRFAEPGFVAVADFEEDVDVTTAGVEGATLAGEDLALWRERDLPFRDRGTKENQVVYLGWRHPPAEPETPATGNGVDGPATVAAAGPAPHYALALPSALAAEHRLDAGARLVFDLAQADRDPPADDEAEGDDDESENRGEDGEESNSPDSDESEGEGESDDDSEDDSDDDDSRFRAPVDLSIVLTDADGTAVALPLSRFRRVPPVIPARITKLPAGREREMYGDPYEPALQTFELPLAAFAAADPAFDPASLAEIRWRFDRSPEGVVILDRVGFAPREPARDPAAPPIDGPAGEAGTGGL